MAVDIESVTSLLLQTREGVVASIKPVLTQHDLTEQQWRVIRELSRHGELNAQRLASESDILSPSLSRILARFAEVGIVVRKADKQDQRAQSIRLSAKGKRLYDKIHPQIDKRYKAMTKSVGSDNLTRLHAALGQVSSALSE